MTAAAATIFATSADVRARHARVDWNLSLLLRLNPVHLRSRELTASFGGHFLNCERTVGLPSVARLRFRRAKDGTGTRLCERGRRRERAYWDRRVRPNA